MKKLLLILLIALFALSGCSGNSKFNPPVWIQGTWGSDSGSNIFTFTSDDIVQYFGSDPSSFKLYYANNAVSESISSDSYIISIKNDSTYSFTMNYDASLNYRLTSDGVTYGTIILSPRSEPTKGTVICSTSETGTWNLHTSPNVIKTTSNATFINVAPGIIDVGFVFAGSGNAFVSPSFTVEAGKTTEILMTWSGGLTPNWSITGPY